MPPILDQLARYFDGKGWRYHLDQAQGRLRAGFQGQHGPLTLTFSPLHEQAMLIEVPGLATVSAQEEAALLTLAWNLAGIALARDPADGEVRARLLQRLRRLWPL